MGFGTYQAALQRHHIGFLNMISASERPRSFHTASAGKRPFLISLRIGDFDALRNFHLAESDHSLEPVADSSVSRRQNITPSAIIQIRSSELAGILIDIANPEKPV